MYYSRDYNSEQGYRSKNPRYEGKDKYPRKKLSLILPPPSVLRSYDEISPGAADRIMDMAEIEQIHRHEWEDRALISYTRSYRMGQLLGALVAIFVVLGALYAAEGLHDKQLAYVIAGSGFASLLVSTIFAARTKRYESRRRRSNHHHEERKYDSSNDESDEDKQE